jgi:hypothetical protein
LEEEETTCTDRGLVSAERRNGTATGVHASTRQGLAEVSVVTVHPKTNPVTVTTASLGSIRNRIVMKE